MILVYNKSLIYKKILIYWMTLIYNRSFLSQKTLLYLLNDCRIYKSLVSQNKVLFIEWTSYIE